MFTGIVQTKTRLCDFNSQPGLITFSIVLENDLARDISLGASIALNGICLTVTKIDVLEVDGDDVCRVKLAFDAMQQTIDLTNAQEFCEGHEVNVERSAKAMQEIGGHIVSGHIDAQAGIVDIIKQENNCRYRFGFPEQFSKYILDKGFVSLNGCSLTVAKVDAAKAILDVCFIPETLRATTFGALEVGDKVNLEVDRQTQAIVDTVERVLAQSNKA